MFLVFGFFLFFKGYSGFVISVILVYWVFLGVMGFKWCFEVLYVCSLFCIVFLMFLLCVGIISS